MAYDISIIVVNYNQAALTLKCLDSIAAMDTGGHNIHTILVDNGSQEELKLPKRYLDNDVELLRSASNLGFTGGNNMGMHAALERHNSEFVLLLNNDAVLDKRAVIQLCKYAEAHPTAGLICPKIYFFPGDEYHNKSYSRSQRGKVFWYAGGSIDWLNLNNFHRGVDEVDLGHFDPQLFSDFATGCALFIRREALEKVGLLQKKYFLYYEDADWSMRARRMGYDIGFASNAKVWHHNAGSSGGAGSALHEYYQTRNRLLFFWTFGDWKTRKTTISLALRFLLNGTKMERRAATDAILRRYGKQPIT